MILVWSNKAFMPLLQGLQDLGHRHRHMHKVIRKDCSREFHESTYRMPSAAALSEPSAIDMLREPQAAFFSIMNSPVIPT